MRLKRVSSDMVFAPEHRGLFHNASLGEMVWNEGIYHRHSVSFIASAA